MTDDRPHVLLVDDSPEDRRRIRGMLVPPGDSSFRVSEAGEVAEALPILENGPVDLVLLDLDLLETRGLDTVRALRTPLPDVPLVVLTGLDDEDTALEALREGAHDYLIKGHEDERSLRRAVRMALERAALLREVESHYRLVQQRDDRLRALAESATDGIVTTDGEGRILFWNASAASIFGRTNEEMLSEPVTRLVPPTAWDTLVQPYVDVGNGNDPAYSARGQASVEFEATSPKGGTVPVEVSLYGWLEGKERRFTAILRDVAERRAAQDAIESLSRQYELILSSAGQGILGVDAHGVVTFANPAAAQLSGWDTGQLVGRSIYETLLSSGGDDDPVQVGDRPLERDGWKAGELAFRSADGTSFPVRMTQRPIQDPGGDDGVVLVFDDISEATELAEQLRQSQKLEVVGRLSGGLAHDFNNEMAVVLLNVGLALQDAQDGQPVSLESLTEIRDAASRASRITRQLLNFARQTPLKREVVDLDEVLNRLASTVEKLIPETIRLHVEVTTESHLANVDRSVVEQAALNLVTNAGDAMPEGGDLTLALEQVTFDGDLPPFAREAGPGTYCCLGVSDTGAGMNPAVLERATEPFFTTKEKGKGTGLGLAMVYGLTTQLGGFMNIESELGSGTTVRLYFPVAAEAQPKAVPSTLDRKGELRGSVILLVDDEEALLDVSARVLRRLGCAVLPVMSVSEALEAYAAQPDRVDAVVSDLALGERDGIDLYDALRERWGYVPFVLTTGHAEGDRAIPDDLPIVLKPWDLDTLVETLINAIHQTP